MKVTFVPKRGEHQRLLLRRSLYYDTPAVLLPFSCGNAGKTRAVRREFPQNAWKIARFAPRKNIYSGTGNSTEGVERFLPWASRAAKALKDKLIQKASVA